MQIIDVANIKAGQTFSQPLFHPSGRKLLTANTLVTPLHLEALVRTGVSQVYLADSARDVVNLADAGATLVAVADLLVGSTAETDLMTPDGVVIVQQNEQIEDHHLAALRDSAVDFVIARPPADAETVHATMQSLARVVLARVEAQIKRGEYQRAPEALDPLLGRIPVPRTLEVLNLNAVQLLRRRLSSRLQPVYGMLETGKSPDMKVLEGITDDLMDQMRSEPRQFSQLALMTARREDYLPDHAISVAVLAMAIATHMGLAQAQVREVVLGALLFDVGMLLIPKRVRTGSGALSPGDRERVQEHPVMSITLMEHITELSAIPRIMGYQHHERLNGTGYPAHAVGDAISDYARIIAVADVFAASTNPRAYKTAKLPYNAMEELVHLAHRGQVDVRAVKALLAAIGLFPVGSFVVLSNGIQAQVVGANATRIDRPLLCPLTPGGLPGAIIDLSEAKYERVKVVRAIAAPGNVAV